MKNYTNKLNVSTQYCGSQGCPEIKITFCSKETELEELKWIIEALTIKLNFSLLDRIDEDFIKC